MMSVVCEPPSSMETWVEMTFRTTGKVPPLSLIYEEGRRRGKKRSEVDQELLQHPEITRRKSGGRPSGGVGLRFFHSIQGRLDSKIARSIS